jgi:hypothetical protein
MTREEACASLSWLAGWAIPPDHGDPHVIDVAVDIARRDLTARRTLLDDVINALYGTAPTGLAAH